MLDNGDTLEVGGQDTRVSVMRSVQVANAKSFASFGLSFSRLSVQSREALYSEDALLTFAVASLLLPSVIMPPRPRPRRRLHGGQGSVNDTSNPIRSSTPMKAAPRLAQISSLPPSSPPSASPLELHDGYAEPSDPFGFLAVEKRLKLTKPKLALASRTNRPVQTRASQSVGASEASSETSHISEAFATPVKELPLLSSPASAATPANQSPRTPTPRRRRNKRRAPETPSSGGADTPGRGTVPSTPSPDKAASHSPGEDLPALQKVVEEVAAAQAKLPSKARGGKGKKSGKSKKSDETLAQEELGAITEELQALLPSRPQRKPPLSRKDPAVQPTAPKQASKRAGPSKKKRKKVQGKQQDEGEIIAEREGESYVLDGDEREVSSALSLTGDRTVNVVLAYQKFVADRQTRLEYFQRLDQYEVQKENVYII